MVSRRELRARVQDFFTFSRQEITGLVFAILITTFIFSFRDWGEEQFEAAIGLQHFVLVLLIVLVSVLFRISCQKIYGLAEGYNAEFKVWWAGLAIALVLAFISNGRLSVVFIGTMSVAFMVKQRLGEFRYGFSYWNNGVIAYWGILGSVIMAILFALGLYFLPQSYFFYKGLIFNLIMALSSLVPLPQLDGLQVFFGSRALYFIALGLVLLTGVLLLSRTALGLVLAVFVGVVYGVIYYLIGSEK
ncbi:hypothetical protein HYU22_01915 [Candidatus Woesearchaeota archaeon]|nr:hypothetical protein [Candidatus Woesearchaeota archaeon]